MLRVMKLTLVLSLFLSALLYVHGENELMSYENFNETVRFLSLWSGEENVFGDYGSEKFLKYQSDDRVEEMKPQKCKVDDDCEKPKLCLGFFKVCYRKCTLDSDCESHMECLGSICFWKTCKNNSECRNSICARGNCLRVCDCGANGTCSFRNGRKTCNCSPGFPEKNGKCTETCNGAYDCANGGKCEIYGWYKFCSCKSGFYGDKCKTPFDCTPNGKYKDCTKNGRKCYYDGSKAVCDCAENEKLHDKEHVCKVCDCGPNGVCSFVNGEKKCECKTGFFEKNGTCTDCICRGGRCVMEDGKEVCKCPPGFGNFTNISCKACDCGPDTDCLWEGGFPGKKVCFCKPGYNMTKEKCVACDCGFNSSCEFISEGWLQPERKICYCQPGFNDINGKCVDKDATTSRGTTESYTISSSVASTIRACDCGPESISCEWISDGQLQPNRKICHCKPGYNEENGKCIKCICKNGECIKEGDKEICKCPPGFGNITKTSCKACDCGPDIDCIWESGVFGKKVCLCKPEYNMKKGKCVACDCGPNTSCEWKSGWFQPESKICHCKLGFYEINGTCVETTSSSGATESFTISSSVSSTIRDCHCGQFSHSCTWDSKSNKVCNCLTGYSQLDGTCAECNCGPYGTFSFRNGQKKCNCKSFATERKGVCVDKEDLANSCKCP